MKVALYHDWLTGFRGGERVLEAFCELFPDAPIYTMIYEKGVTSPVIDEKVIYTSILNKLPSIKNHYRKLLPTFPHVIKSFKVKEDYDLILSSSHCAIKGVKKPSGSLHISYIHSPMRYMYDQFENYFGAHAPKYQQVGAKAFRGYLTKWDKENNENVDHMIANSGFVKDRIEQFYQREADVIHPFVDLKDFDQFKNRPPQKEEFYLIVSAFAPNKKVELAIKAFNANGKKLKIIGSGQQERYLKSISQNNIEFLGSLPREEVVKNLSMAKALIFPGVEDFGIVPLESMASGTPVIAYREGGVLETLNEKTSEFFSSPDEKSLNQAIDRFEKRDFFHGDLVQRANDFSKEKFKQEIKSYIEKKMEKKA